MYGFDFSNPKRTHRGSVVPQKSSADFGCSDLSGPAGRGDPPAANDPNEESVSVRVSKKNHFQM
jgi:hypothetical protein